jgi:hypothetical protein
MAETDIQAIAVRLLQTERDLADLRDLRAIENVLARYSRALDWLDDEVLNPIFFDDAEIDYGFFKGSGKDFKPVLMAVERSMGRRWHFTSQVQILLEGSAAEVESYNFSVAATAESPGPASEVMHFYGKYVDRFEKRGGRWGIIRRKHLQIGAATIAETAMQGPLAVLNQIGAATPRHSDYRRLIGNVDG